MELIYYQGDINNNFSIRNKLFYNIIYCCRADYIQNLKRVKN